MAIVDPQQELYCLIPRHLEDRLLNPLRTWFAARGVQVIVDRRNTGRPIPYDVQRQRAMHLPRSLPELPSEAEPHAEELALLQRMPSAGLDLADAPLAEVVARAQYADGLAATELVWRINARVYARLERTHDRAHASANVEAALGRVLDRVSECAAHDEAGILAWVDAAVDGAPRD